MKEKVQSALDNYVLAYTNNDKSLFRNSKPTGGRYGKSNTNSRRPVYERYGLS